MEEWGSITDAGYTLCSGDRTASREKEGKSRERAKLCVERRVDWKKREAGGKNRGRGAFSKKSQGFEGGGRRVCRECFKSERRSGEGDPLCCQIKGLQEETLLSARAEESQRGWGVSGSPGTVAVQSKSRGVCSTDRGGRGHTESLGGDRVRTSSGQR